MAERPCWEAQIDLKPLARASFPKVVVTGKWDQAHPAYRASTGDALVACGSFVAEQIGARLVQVPGADHFPHRDRSGIVNALLREVWNAAAGQG
jgi:pimeloyl-ACP methyl ester carboxylesterase